MSFLTSKAYATSIADTRPAIALVTGGKSGIGLALAKKIATFPFIEQVLAVSRSITEQDVKAFPKITPLAADVGSDDGRSKIVQKVESICKGQKQLRFLIHSAGTIDPIKPVLEVQPEELRRAMLINCEAPFLLTTALYPYMKPLDDNGVAGRVLHVSSGAAHGAPPAGWGVYGITKAAFFQSFRVLEKEFRQEGKVVVGSFKPGVVDTSMQGLIRDSTEDSMPNVQYFRSLKEKLDDIGSTTCNKARPPPTGALDSPDNVAFFAEYLLLGTTDEEFANANDPSEYDIRNRELFHHWIPEENLPSS